MQPATFLACLFALALVATPVLAKEGGPDSPNLQTNDTYDWTAPGVGVYEYYCKIHPSMRGNVTVTEGTPQSAAPVDVFIHSNVYDPASIRVVTGTNLRWTNHDGYEHTVSTEKKEGGSPLPLVVALAALAVGALVFRRR